jgi:D-lactate dehydrogenase (cytochrome)
MCDSLICLDEMSIRAVNTNENLTLKEVPTLLFEFSGTKNEVDEQIKSVVEISEKNKGTGFRYAQSDKVSIL